MNQAIFVTNVLATDPDSKGDVEMSVFKHQQSGGMFAIDNSFLDQCFEDDEDPVIDDPFNYDMQVTLLGL